MNETYSKFRIGKILSDTFPIQHCMKEGDALSPFLLVLVLEYAIRKVETNQVGNKLNRICQCLLYRDQTFVLEVKPEKTEFVFLQSEQNSLKNHNTKLAI